MRKYKTYQCYWMQPEPPRAAPVPELPSLVLAELPAAQRVPILRAMRKKNPAKLDMLQTDPFLKQLSDVFGAQTIISEEEIEDLLDE